MTQPRSGVSAILLSAAGATALFAIAIAVGTLMDADHGTLPDWVAAIATVAAFGAACIAGWYAHRALMVEQERDRHRDEQAQRAQAELVAAWSQLVWFGAAGPTTRPLKNALSEYRLFVRNASELPVLNLRAVVSGRVYGPGNSQEVYRLGEVDLEVVPPTQEPEQPSLGSEIYDALRQLRQQLGPGERLGVTVGIIFTDTGGRHWIRDDDGGLKPAPPELVRLRAAELPL